MFIVTLLTNPATPKLDRVTVESLRNAWGGGDAVWLDPGVAAEFPVEQMPANRWEVWDGLQAMGIDMAVQRAEGRRKRMLIADMDSTIVTTETLDELAGQRRDVHLVRDPNLEAARRDRRQRDTQSCRAVGGSPRFQCNK